MSKAGKLNNNRAFTLVELGVVMLLMCIFCVLALPLLGSVGSGSMRRSADRLAAMARYLYNETALTACRHRLVLDIDRGVARAQVFDRRQWRATGATVRAYHLPDNVSIKDVWIEDRGLLNSGTATLQFHPQGYVSATTIHLRRRDGVQLSLHLLPLSASAEIEDGYRKFD